MIVRISGGKSVVFMLFCWGLLGAAVDAAELRVSSLFSDNMVLQRNQPVRIFGKAEPGKTVNVKLADRRLEVKAAEDRTWQAEFLGMSAGGPYSIHVVSGTDSVEIKNVLIGDVWICAGQSNMQIGVGQYENCEKKGKVALSDQLRLFQNSRQGWLVADSPRPAFSAVGYLFGIELVKTRKIPIGLINLAQGGSRIEAWIDRQTLQRAPALKPVVEMSENGEKLAAVFGRKLKQWESTGRKGQRPVSPFPARWLAGGIFESIRARSLLKFPVRGVLWYQGENNVELDHDYGHLLKTMIRDWRQQWHLPDLWFLVVQLPGMSSGNKKERIGRWPKLREGQDQCLQLANTALVVMADTGGNLHPWNKTLTAHRLALLARNHIYGEKVRCAGPRFEKCAAQGRSLVVSFAGVKGSLKSRGKQVNGFVIAGADRRFHPATAKIAGNSVHLTSPTVAKPTAVRYGWYDDTTQANLTDDSGFPVAPFRTDNWDGPLPDR